MTYSGAFQTFQAGLKRLGRPKCPKPQGGPGATGKPEHPQRNPTVQGSTVPTTGEDAPPQAGWEEVAPNPDLYGPFWVSTTLVFSMAAAGTFANYLGTRPRSSQVGPMAAR